MQHAPCDAKRQAHDVSLGFATERVAGGGQVSDGAGQALHQGAEFGACELLSLLPALGEAVAIALRGGGLGVGVGLGENLVAFTQDVFVFGTKPRLVTLAHVEQALSSLGLQRGKAVLRGFVLFTAT